jgi:hypothetical protein
LLADEPATDRSSVLAKVNSTLLETISDIVPYINLFPTYATPAQLGTATYEEYVDLYMRTVKPKILGFGFILS